MSVTTEVFVRCDGSLADLAAEVQTLTGITPTFVPDSEDSRYDRYEWRGESLEVVITYADGFENDGDLLFEQYPYYIPVRALNIAQSADDWTRLDAERDQFARTLFDKLKATGRYGLMLVYDVQEKLDEFEPAPTRPALVK